MQKIKFKIEYKPLSDKAIDQYKNFDGLMAMYAAAPKPNLFQRIFKNRWTMFSGGIIIGSAITALIAINAGNDHTEKTIAFTQPDAISQLDELNQMPADETKDKTIALKDQNTISDKSSINENNSSAEVNSTSSLNTINENTNQNGIGMPEDEKINSSSENALGAGASALHERTAHLIPVDELIALAANADDEPEITDKENAQTTQLNGSSLMYELPESAEKINQDHGVDTENVIAYSSDEKKSENSTSEKTTSVNQDENKTKEKSVREDKLKQEKTASETATVKDENRSSGNAPAHEENKITILDKIFDKTEAVQHSAENIDTAAAKKDDTYINRYAQLSFFTPLSTNGIESYKYKHYVSFNIIQGFNGAVNGAEFGGVLNLDKGYMTGGQFAGVANLVGGDVKGFQGAGVMNISKDVKGFQGAGVMNTVVGNMTGFQGAGVMNIAVNKLNGFQAAGVLNINTSLDTTTFWQAAGVANFSIAHSTGAQTAGILNIANDHTGAQIGLINVAKKITGTQIGLINIADSIDGAAIGLLSFSRNGIFDIDISTNDFLPLNAAIRVGGPMIYNIFTFGILPSADTATYGYGIGIGGEIPFDKFYVDIDAIGWNIHQDKFEFNFDYFHMNNQLRVTPGYKINKFISVYAGPVVNVETFDNALIPLHTNPIREFSGSAFTTNISAGYVAGIRFF